MMYATNQQRQPSLLGLYPNSPTSEMTDEPRTYLAYLLRLGRVNSGRALIVALKVGLSVTGVLLAQSD